MYKINKIVFALPGLLFLACLFFIWAKNSHSLTVDLLIYSLSAAIILFVLSYLFFYIFSKIIYKFSFPYAKCILNILISICCGLVLNTFILRITFFPYHHEIMYAAMLIFLGLLTFKAEKFAAFFSCIMIVISGVNLIQNIVDDYNQYQTLYDNWIKKEENSKTVKFKNFPNVYLFWQESYQDADVIKKLYKYDNSGFESYLKSKNFFVYDNTLSTEGSTLLSLASTYTLGKYDLTEAARNNSDASMLIRDIIGGNDLNFVYKTFKENGYSVVFGTDYVPYYLRESYSNLDFAYGFYKSFYLKFMPVIMGTKYYGLYGAKTDYRDIYDLYLAIEKQISSPRLVIIKGGAKHTDSVGYTYLDKETYTASYEYQSALEKANAENKKIIEHIIANDNNAIIIILGDHGTHLTRGLSLNNKGIFNSSGEQINLFSLEDFIDDRYNVILAVRMPKGENYDLSQGYYMNNSNVFSHVFSFLAQDPAILEGRTCSVTYYNKIMLANEGKKKNSEGF